MSWSTKDVAGLMLMDLSDHRTTERFFDGYQNQAWVHSKPTATTPPAMMAHRMRLAGTQSEFIHRELRRRFPEVTLLNVYRCVTPVENRT